MPCSKRSGLLPCLLLSLLLVSGCQSGSGGLGHGAVRELHLFGVPVAINFDQKPGADGFAARVYAGNGREPAGIRIGSGRLEILIYDGAPSDAARTTQPPLKVWTYEAAKLREFAARSSIGWGYRFAPQWGESCPTKDRFTVVARYISPSGVIVSSSPGVISMILQ